MAAPLEIITPNTAGLRRFALLLALLLVLFFGLLIPWLWHLSWPLWPWLLGGATALWGLAAPRSLGPLYRAWMRLGLLLQRVVSPLVLAALYLLLFVPTALLMRLFRYDPLALRIDRQAPSYRIPSRRPPRDQMEKPY